ncbi:MAG TPA: hypothetical protein VGG28_27640, partial [Kofleriaceae bacterium]
DRVVVGDAQARSGIDGSGMWSKAGDRILSLRPAELDMESKLDHSGARVVLWADRDATNFTLSNEPAQTGWTVHTSGNHVTELARAATVDQRVEKTD